MKFAYTMLQHVYEYVQVEKLQVISIVESEKKKNQEKEDSFTFWISSKYLTSQVKIK